MEKRKQVLIVGLQPELIDFSSPEYAAFPGLTAEKVLEGLNAGAASLRAQGYEAQICLTDFGATADDVLRNALIQNQYDCVLVGAGVRTVPTHFLLFEKIINTIHAHAPGAKICFNTKPSDTAEAVNRWI
ncbi:hypothetical protein [Limnobacter sp.]|jgi:hypothetical protein|uniref:hypothetical protein n=1 Tax=Limnobacter sp. TaxID=2003368 RepID=UPI002736A05D|nr:hypothetical protein [Limnobacter sp.]MDP3270349.1 hypothetical protein [Limnobacter sp.]